VVARQISTRKESSATPTKMQQGNTQEAGRNSDSFAGAMRGIKRSQFLAQECRAVSGGSMSHERRRYRRAYSRDPRPLRLPRELSLWNEPPAWLKGSCPSLGAELRQLGANAQSRR